MSVQKFTDAGVFYDKYNMTGDANKCAVELSAAMLDGSTFGVGTKVNVAGLTEAKASVAGLWEVDAGGGTPDPFLFTQIGSAVGVPLTVYPQNVENGVAYMLPVIQGSLNWWGAVGDIAPFSGEFSFSKYAAAATYLRYVRGYLGLQAISKSAAGNGNYVVFPGVITASQCVQMFVHLLSFTGTSVTFNLVSDDNSSFTTPITRVTSGAMAAAGSYAGLLAGPVATDTYWRIAWTGTITSFTAVVSYGYAAL